MEWNSPSVKHTVLWHTQDNEAWGKFCVDRWLYLSIFMYLKLITLVNSPIICHSWSYDLLCLLTCLILDMLLSLLWSARSSKFCGCDARRQVSFSDLMKIYSLGHSEMIVWTSPTNITCNLGSWISWMDKWAKSSAKLKICILSKIPPIVWPHCQHIHKIGENFTHGFVMGPLQCST